ncbi:MAG: head-tail connector protein [Hyphomicrobium sp.]|uniref:head-tail connector protein n=1 Tax=Hyphomicrobium sp. TaxID=82 RepID=UPI003D09A0CC
MALTLLSGPAEEPVTVAEAKAHLRLDGSAEDILVASLILTSRLHVEAALGLALITQDWRLTLDAWPEGGIVKFPLRPIQGITSVVVKDAAGTPITVSSGTYLLDGAAMSPRLIARDGGWPAPGLRAGGIEIAFEAGIGDEAEDVPQPIRHAILLLVAHWYEHRDPLEIGSPAAAIPPAVSELLRPYREVSL